MALLFHVSGDRSFYFQIAGIIHRHVVWVYRFHMRNCFFKHLNSFFIKFQHKKKKKKRNQVKGEMNCPLPFDIFVSQFLFLNRKQHLSHDVYSINDSTPILRPHLLPMMENVCVPCLGPNSMIFFPGCIGKLHFPAFFPVWGFPGGMAIDWVLINGKYKGWSF